MKKYLLLFLLISIVITISGCKKEYPVYGDFIYDITGVEENGFHGIVEDKGIRICIRIINLSEEGKTKEILIVPEYIEGIKVECIGTCYLFNSYWDTQNLKRVYIPFYVNDLEHDVFYHHCDNLEKVFMLTHERDGGEEFFEDTPLYITGKNYDPEVNVTNVYRNKNGYGCDCYFAKVSYMYNYEGSKLDGYYWIDDYSYGEKIEYIPDNPVREGYTFKGWYKEPECINEWNFDIDTLPEIKWSDGGEVMYQETKLYAKWV